MEDKKIINVNMLGGFSLSQGKEPIPLEYANTTKMTQKAADRQAVWE